MDNWNGNRPLLPVTLLFTGGVLLARAVPFPWQPLLAIASGAVLLAVVWSRPRATLLAAAIFLAGAADDVFHTAVISPLDLRARFTGNAGLVTLRGHLLQTPQTHVYDHRAETAHRSLAQVEVSHARETGGEWQPAAGRVAVSTPGILPEKFFAGQAVEITGTLLPPRPAVAEGTFDHRAQLERQGIYFQLQAQSPDDWKTVPPPARTPLSTRFIAWSRRTLALGLPQPDESLRLECALTLGDKSVLTDAVSEPFVRAATYHIFAVDGLRMAILFGLFLALFRAAGLPLRLCGVLLLPLIWFYTALTGWPASAIRATVMLTVVVFGWACKRPPNLLNSLFAAALIILCWQPQQLFQAGFQLSFFVVLSIILILPPLERLGEFLLRTDPSRPAELRPPWQKMLLVPSRFALDLLLVSFAAWLGSIPLAAYYFHVFTPVSAAANLLAIPLCALALAANILSLLLGAWLPAGAAIFNHAGWALMESIRATSGWSASLPGAYFYVRAPGWFGIGVYYFALLGLLTGWLFRAPFRTAKIFLLALLVAIWGWQFQRENSATRLTVLPVGGGSAVFCDGPGLDDLLVDTGNEAVAQFVVKPFLRAQGVNQLPQLLLTHGDSSAIGGAKFISDQFAVPQIITSAVPPHSPSFHQLEPELQQSPQRWRRVERGETLGAWKVLHPERFDKFTDADDNAVVLRGEFSGTRVLLLSDLRDAGQLALLERNTDLRADIVVAGLPATGEPLCGALLDAVQPRVIIVADAEAPATKRASAALRERLESRGTPVFYTRETGALTLTFREGGWELRGMDGTRRDF